METSSLMNYVLVFLITFFVGPAGLLVVIESYSKEKSTKLAYQVWGITTSLTAAIIAIGLLFIW